ncbi:MAG TPA: TIGR02996 domain-containing protein, partial [Gemmataceae bacterium]|nr:TIGR02996 domain-containing protein [Gemmataceae bacterium]
MRLEDAFLRDILEHPEDTPRLVYADWLDEHGETERAEFVRVQVALAAMSKADHRRAALLERNKALLPAQQKAWTEKLSGLAATLEFERGLPVQATLTARAFLAGADRLLALTPVRSVRLTATSKRLREVANCPHLAALTALDLRAEQLGSTGARLLASSPYLARLRRLDLSCNPLGAAGARALAQSPHLGGLTRLALSWSRLGDEGATALASSPHLTGLTALDIPGNQLG